MCVCSSFLYFFSLKWNDTKQRCFDTKQRYFVPSYTKQTTTFVGGAGGGGGGGGGETEKKSSF